MVYGVLAVVWIATSILSYGICLDWHKRNYPYFTYGFRWGFSDFFGPVGLFASLMIHSGKYGFQLRPFTRDERYENFCKMYGSQYKTREQFDKEY